MNDSTIINKNFTASLFPKNIGKIFEDFGEVAIDSMITDGVLKDIPIIGTILNPERTAFDQETVAFFKKPGGYFYRRQK
jgi:hypothetical protein